MVEVLPVYIFYPTKPSFSNSPTLSPSPPPRKLIYLIFRKTQLHFLQIIPQPLLKSRFPHEKHGGFHMNGLTKLINSLTLTSSYPFPQRYFKSRASVAESQLTYTIRSGRICTIVSSSFSSQPLRGGSTTITSALICSSRYFCGSTSSALPTKNSAFSMPFNAAFLFRVLDCLRNDLNTAYAARIPGQKQGDRADTAVQIPHRLVSRQTCILQRKFIQFPGLNRINLIKESGDIRYWMSPMLSVM